ncbi:MAG TPA: carbon-nitrogen hydrolase family protein [archaeon]|nr:carbon-nitrogen hydrolase family protein [archaeon]
MQPETFSTRSKRNIFVHYLSALLIGGVSLCILALLLLTAAAGRAFGLEAKVIFEASSFDTEPGAGTPAGWACWSQREEIRPDFFIAGFPSLGGSGSLGISSASNSAANGCWRKLVPGIQGGGYYRFEASYCARGVPNPAYQVIARLDWRGPEDQRVGQPEYVPDSDLRGEWRKLAGTFLAPEGAVSARIELYLRFCEQGTVWWDGISLGQVPKPPRRMVRVGTVNCRPAGHTRSEESVEEFALVAEEAGKKGCDIVCLGEGINLIGVRGVIYPDIAEPIPGPTTERLSQVAGKWNMYIVACLGERDGPAVYCTSVLIDRQGQIAGKYRKVHIPREETETGVSPGDSYPVFDTDFGRLGMMICFDLQYTAPARALAVQGAEIIFAPIWGGNPVLARARCIENQVYLVICGYDMASTIHDPWGSLLAEARERPGVATVDIDLSEPHPDQWLGNMRQRFFREIRPDIRVPGLE